jgi:hypothetical protein
MGRDHLGDLVLDGFVTLKWIIKKIGRECVVSSGYGSAMGPYELSGCMKGGRFLDQLNNYHEGF